MFVEWRNKWLNEWVIAWYNYNLHLCQRTPSQTGLRTKSVSTDAWVIVSDLQMSILLNFASFFSFKTFCKNSKHWIKTMLYFDWLTEERWRMVSSHLPKCHGFQEHHHTQNYALPSSKRIYCWLLRKDQFSFLLNYFSFQTSLNKNLKYFGHLKD